jgi:hypothetical protein
VKHGSYSTYNNHRCRCTPCTDAAVQFQARRRLERASLDPPADAHGRSSTYVNWSCRCALCTEAWRVYSQRYRQ